MNTTQLNGAAPKPKREELAGEIPKMIFESLKPLKAVCVENDYSFMAYLIEMTEVEAYRLMRHHAE